MDKKIIEFIAALRKAGIGISIAESIDALQAVEVLGVKDREVFRISLRTTLIKNYEDLHFFDELFPYFFPRSISPLANITQVLTHDEIDMFHSMLEKKSDRSRKTLGNLLSGQNLSSDQLEQIGRIVGLNNIDDMRYHTWMVYRMNRALGMNEIDHAMQYFAELLGRTEPDQARGEKILESLRENLHKIRQQIHQYAGKKISENLNKLKPDKIVNDLINRPFSSLTERDLIQLRHEVHRLATILRTRVALRQRRSKSGHLDAKSTIRKNLSYGGVPFEVKHREKNLKPKLVVICDVSSSMRFCSELMLSLVYALQDQINKTSTFAFIDHIENITISLSVRKPEEAVKNVLNQMSPNYANTDLGNSLKEFSKAYMDKLDKKTTMIIVSDGRNNKNDPRLDIFRMMTQRSRRTIWLNPETPALWGSGDSDMLKYIPYCDDILHINNLTELSQAVDQLLVRG